MMPVQIEQQPNYRFRKHIHNGFFGLLHSVRSEPQARLSTLKSKHRALYLPFSAIIGRLVAVTVPKS